MKSKPEHEALIKDFIAYLMDNWKDNYYANSYTDGTGCFTLMFHCLQPGYTYQMMIYADAKKEKIVKAIARLKERMTKDDFPHIGESTYAKTIIKS